MVNQPGAERLAEYRKAFGQDRAVDAVLQIGMIIAHVELAETILHHAGQLQHDLVELLVVSAGQGLDCGIGNAVGIGAQAFLYGRARFIEPPRGHYDRRVLGLLPIGRVRSRIGAVGGARRARPRQRNRAGQQQGTGNSRGNRHDHPIGKRSHSVGGAVRRWPAPYVML